MGGVSIITRPINLRMSDDAVQSYSSKACCANSGISGSTGQPVLSCCSARDLGVDNCKTPGPVYPPSPSAIRYILSFCPRLRRSSTICLYSPPLNLLFSAAVSKPPFAGSNFLSNYLLSRNFWVCAASDFRVSGFCSISSSL